MQERLQAIVRRALGDGARMDAFEKWGFGALNDTYKLVTRDPSEVLFVKIERQDIVPTTRRGQVAREVASMRLMQQAGIACPTVLSHDIAGREIGRPYLVERFIDAQLMWELRESLSPGEWLAVRSDIELILQKMSQIAGACFGDLHEGGAVGRHPTWPSAFGAMAAVLLSDAQQMELFTADQQQVVGDAMDRAADRLVSSCPAGWCHGDLGMHNVMADRSSGQVRVGQVIDFGNAWLGPAYANEDGCRRHGGFGLDVHDVAARYGVGPAEYEANDLLLAFEHTVFMAMLHRRNGQPAGPATEPFVHKCRGALHAGPRP